MLLECRKATLAAELRLDLWIELSWYAMIENWNPAWKTAAQTELQHPDKWWIASGQYKSISFWLSKLIDYGAKEINLYEY